MSADGKDWRGPVFRKKVINQIEEAVRQAGNPTTKSSHEMENHVFQKAKTREEYLALVARLILHVKDINSQKEKKAAQAAAAAAAAAAGLPPSHAMHPGTAQLQQQQPGMQDPINALQNLARQGGGHNMPIGHQAPQVGGHGVLSSDQPILAQQLQSFMADRAQSFQQRMQAGPGHPSQQQIQMHQQLMQQRALQQQQLQQQQLLQQRTLQQQQLQQQQQQLQQQQQQQQQQLQVGQQPQVPSLQRQDAFIVTSPQQAPVHMSPIQSQAMGPGSTQLHFQAGTGPVQRQMGQPGYPTPQQVNYVQSPGPPPQSVGQQMAPSPAQQSMVSHHSPANVFTSPSPQPSIVPSPASKNMSIGAPSPGTSLNTPGNPGSVGTVPSPASRNPQEDQAYLDKLKQLSKYIEPLRRMVNRIDKDEGNRKKDQLSKMKNLLDILSDSTKRLPMATLLKCEQVLEKLELYPKGGPGSVGSSMPTAHIKPTEQHMCQPLLDAVAAYIRSPMLNHTLHRSFGPAMTAINGPPIRAQSPPLTKKRKRDEEEEEDDDNEVSDLLQGEVARLDNRFRVNLYPAYSTASKTVHLLCHLHDKNLPSVPPIIVTVPDNYPDTSPSCDTSSEDYDSTPFLQAIQRSLSLRMLKMPDKFSLTALLNTWEMTVRQACIPNLVGVQ